MDWFQKLLPPKIKEAKVQKKPPYLRYFQNKGVLQVLFRGSLVYRRMFCHGFDVIIDNGPTKRRGAIIGFNFYGARGMLYDQGYKKSSITLEHFVKRFTSYHSLPYGQNVLGAYEQQILKLIRKYQFVWHIPK